MKAGKRILSALLAIFTLISVAPLCSIQASAAAEQWLWPVEGIYKISSNYGNRTVNGKKGTHRGIDIPGSAGTPIRAAKSGTIYDATNKYGDSQFVENSFGNCVYIDHNDGTYSLYAHLKQNGVKTCDTVQQGEIIGYMGNSGQSYGNHLHFQIYTNPEKYNASSLNPMPTNSNIKIINNYSLPSGWPTAKTTYCFDTTSMVRVTYPSNCTIKATASTKAMTMPCSSSSDANSKVVASVAAGATYKSTALILNKYGNHWYQVSLDGTTAYIPSAKMTFVKDSTADIAFTGATAPTTLAGGSSFSVGGTIKAPGHNIETVYAYVYPGTATSGTAATGGSVYINSQSYSLKGSALDNKIKFGSLKAGTYTYVVSVDYINYYAKTEKTRGENTGKLTVYTKTFTVTPRKYTITYNANGGSGAPSSQTCTEGQTATVSTIIPVRSGYKFLGWSKSMEATQADYKAGASLGAVSGNMTLYAVWADVLCSAGTHSYWNGKCKVCHAADPNFIPLTITTQPKTVYAKAGKLARTTVAASGMDLRYQWYVKSAGNSDFIKSAVTTASYSAKMDSKSKDRQVYCVITDKYGNTAQTVTVYLRQAVSISAQPTSVVAAMGEPVTISFQAAGDGLKYVWYYKNAGASKYSRTNTFTGNTYTITSMDATRHGRRILCKVTDQYGNTVKTNSVTISMKAGITTQPKTTYTKLGDTARVSLKAAGDGLKYEWYYKDKGATAFRKTSSFTGPAYYVEMTAARASRQVYCKVTDQYGNTVKSNTVTLRMAASVVTQPKSVAVAKGATAKVTVKAAGDGLKYAWYYKDAGSSSFKKTATFTGTTYTAEMTAARSGRQIYCRITDKYGNTVKTNTVTLKVK